MNDRQKAPFVGRSLLRREDRRLLTGRASSSPISCCRGMLHAVFVRSPLAHARIRGVDLSRAAAAPGVVLALSGVELAQMLPPVPEGQISLPSKWTTVVQHKFLNPRQPLLAHDKVRHVGEAVAVIVAETRYQAEDAAELVSRRSTKSCRRSSIRRRRCAPARRSSTTARHQPDRLVLGRQGRRRRRAWRARRIV